MPNQPESEPADDLSLSPASEEPISPASSPPRLLLSQSALEAMREHGYTDTAHECGGVLVGAKLEGEQGPVVLVEAVIAGAHTDARRGSVTFTHETWEHINREKDQKYSDLRIVGWYHTHPGFGIFLSDYDQFIQQNFFNLPWNVAFVLDPLSGEAGAFGWVKGKITRLPEYEAYGPPSISVAPVPRSAPAAVEASQPVPTATTQPTAASARQNTWVGALTVVLLIAVLAVSVLGLTRPPSPVLLPPAPIVQPPAPPVAPPPAAPAGPAPAVSYVWYTVQEGDYFWKIAQQYYGRGDMWGLIAATNGLRGRETQLNPGMKLLIPLPPEQESDGAG